MARRLPFALIAGLVLAGSSAAAVAGTLCTLVVDSTSGAMLTENGDCESRVTSASTFKIALAAIGFEEGLLQGPHEPVRQYRKGEVDWGGRAWRGRVDPTSWMKHSVVWYSQRLTRQLGAEKLEAWMRALGYGNADFSGDPGKGNGLERAWIASSLAISPREQARFLRGLLIRTLPLSGQAMTQTEALVERFSIEGGWTLNGKTGAAYPRRADGSFNRARGYGWFVGWARRGDTRVVFVRLTQDEVRHSESPGLRARNALLAEWPALSARFGR